jgi:hypothetical protein
MRYGGKTFSDVRSQHGDTAIAVMDELGFLTAEDI